MTCDLLAAPLSLSSMVIVNLLIWTFLENHNCHKMKYLK